jgi:uncharacterized protein (DUF1499 family)
MVRRRISEDPVSRLAVWARRLALFALATAILGTLIVRAGLLEMVPALATVAGALVLAGAAILAALASLVVIWREGAGGLGYAVSALAIGAGLIAYPAYLGTKAYRLPMINDVTTDPADPPRLEALSRVRPRSGTNPVTYPGQAFAELQRAAYPELEPMQLSVPPPVAYEVVYEVIGRRKWRIVDARRPQSRGRDGHIEAVARTPIMGFRDDVVIRIRASGDDTRVDIRSASRYGPHDLGANAARVAALIDEIEAAVNALPPARRQPEPPPQEPKPPTARR